MNSGSMGLATSKYSAVTNSSDDELASASDFEGDEKPMELSPADRKKWHDLTIVRFTAVFLVGINIAIAIFSAISLQKAQSLGHYQKHNGSGDYSRPDLNADLKMTSAFSPILDALDLNPTLRTFNGKLRDNSSIWRQPPSKKVDAAWDYISTEGMEVITVSSATLEKSGKDPAKCVKAPPSWGEGNDAYVAQIDVFHLIHCLNELRKEIYFDHYYKTPADELHRSHKNHCIHMLLQNLMCTADVGVVSHNWVHNEHIAEPKTRPMADFDMVKKCRDFDALLDWAREKSVKNLPAKWPQLKYTPGIEIVPGDGYA